MATLSLKEFEDIRLPVPWGHISGRWYGNRQVRPILGIHGWQDNLATFNALIPLLPAHIGLLCIDLPGHGHSSPYPAGIRYSTKDFVLIIICVIKTYKWERVSLLAHSFGAILCYIYTSLYPHTVDMLIGIDFIKSPYRTPSTQIKMLNNGIERLLVENDHFDQRQRKEPPVFEFEELQQVLHKASTMDFKYTKDIVERGTMPSSFHPNKFYFLRDGRLKYYQSFVTEPGLAIEMAKRIKNVPYLVLKATEMSFIQADSKEVIDILYKQNPYFELHEVKGKHHVHLNNAKDCAKFIVPFIERHRSKSKL